MTLSTYCCWWKHKNWTFYSLNNWKCGRHQMVNVHSGDAHVANHEIHRFFRQNTTMCQFGLDCCWRKLALFTNRKSHMSFRRPWMTSNGVIVFSVISTKVQFVNAVHAISAVAYNIRICHFFAIKTTQKYRKIGLRSAWVTVKYTVWPHLIWPTRYKLMNNWWNNYQNILFCHNNTVWIK